MSAVGIVHLVAHEMDEFILCMRDGYAARHKLLGGMNRRLSACSCSCPHRANNRPLTGSDSNSYMAYLIATIVMTLSFLESHSSIASLFKCDISYLWFFPLHLQNFL